MHSVHIKQKYLVQQIADRQTATCIHNLSILWAEREKTSTYTKETQANIVGIAPSYPVGQIKLYTPTLYHTADLQKAAVQ